MSDCCCHNNVTPEVTVCLKYNTASTGTPPSPDSHANVGGAEEVFVTGSSGPAQFRTLLAGDGIDVATTGDTITISSLIPPPLPFTGQNLGGGEEVYIASTADPAQFRTITATGSATVTTVGDTIEINVPATGISFNNVGTGTGLPYAQTVVNEAQFRSITGIAPISVVTNGDDIEISDLTTFANIGGAAGVYSAVSLNEVQLRSINGGNAISATVNGDVIDIDNLHTFANIGGANEILSPSGDLQNFRTLTGLGDITVATNGDVIEISSAAAALTFSNIGTGLDIYAGTLIDDVQFRRIQALGPLSVAYDAPGDSIVIQDNTLYLNIGGADGQVSAGTLGNVVQFRTITGLGDITVATNGDVIEISSAVTALTFENIGGEAEIYSAVVGGVVQLRTITGLGGITVAVNGDVVEISDAGSALTFQNIGAGQGIYSTTVGNTVQLRSISGIGNISVTTLGDMIRIEDTVQLSFVNIGSVTGQVYAGTAPGNIVQFRGVIGTGAIQVSQAGNNIQIQATYSFNNSGLASGIPLFSQVGVALTFRSLRGISPISVVYNAGLQTIDISDATAFQSIGTGQAVYAGAVGNTHQFKSLVAGVGVTLSSTANEITINSTASFSGQNVGGANEVYVTGSTAPAQFRTIVAGSGIDITQAATTLTLAQPNLLTDTRHVGIFIRQSPNVVSGPSAGLVQFVHVDAVNYSTPVTGSWQKVMIPGTSFPITIDGFYNVSISAGYTMNGLTTGLLSGEGPVMAVYFRPVGSGETTGSILYSRMYGFNNDGITAQASGTVLLNSGTSYEVISSLVIPAGYGFTSVIAEYGRLSISLEVS